MLEYSPVQKDNTLFKVKNRLQLADHLWPKNPIKKLLYAKKIRTIKNMLKKQGRSDPYRFFYERDWLLSWTHASIKGAVIVHWIVSAIPATDTSSHSPLSLSPAMVRRCRRKHCCQMAFVEGFNNRCSTCRLLMLCRMALQREKILYVFPTPSLHDNFDDSVAI